MILATLVAALAVLAQFTNEQDPTGLLSKAWPILAVLIPFVVARVTNEAARARIKFGVAAGLSAAVSIVTLLQMDWSAGMATPVLILERAGMVLGLATLTYHLVDAAAEVWFRAGLNDLPAVKPEKGIGA